MNMATANDYSPLAENSKVEFEMKLDALIKNDHWNGYLIAENENTLSLTNLIGFLWEKIKGKIGILGGDRTESGCLKTSILVFLKNNELYIDQSHLKNIRILVERIGLTAASDHQNDLLETVNCINSRMSNPIVKENIFYDPRMIDVIHETDKFASYMIAPVNEHILPVKLTGVNIRPCNLFFHALGFETTMPGEELFAFKAAAKEISKDINEKDSQMVVAISANKISGRIYARDWLGEIVIREEVKDLSDIYGSNTYRISYGEIQEMLKSQRIYTTSLLPMQFYLAFKKALLTDTYSTCDCTLPGNDSYPVKLSTLPQNYVNLIDLYQSVKNNPTAYGFTSQEEFDIFSEQTLYQIGSMVVKTEDYRIFADGKGHILERNIGQKDALRLINACGIRGVHSSETPQKFHENIMRETFKTALDAAESGISLFPAVGMGIWGGNPDLYWPAFFDAVIHSKNELEAICVNPRHRRVWKDKFKRLQRNEAGGLDGNEFQTYLDVYKKKYTNNPVVLSKLNKIVNLYHEKTDLLQLAYNLKTAFPDKIISIFNASDPDVTLGFHVTEYMNNILHADTTEENYGALGTSGLLFETITEVHEDPKRLIQT